MSKNGCIREYCNTWVYNMIDTYFREAGTPIWIWNDAGARLHMTAVGIASIAKGERFPSKPVFDRIVEMAKPLGWTDADKIFGYIARDYVIKNEQLPSGWGNSGWGGFLVAYVVKCIHDILPENDKLEVLGEFDYSTMSPRSGGIEANIIIEKEDLLQKPGLTPKEFLEQNGWFDKAKDAAAKTTKKISDKMTQNIKEATEDKGFATINDTYEGTPLEVKPLEPKPLGWGYDLADKIGMVKPTPNLKLANPFKHDEASRYDRFINELCENISYTNIAKCLYGSELDPEEFIQVYKMLTGYPTCGRSDVQYSYTSSNPPVSKTLDEQLLNKIIIAVIRKVAQEIKDTDKED